MPYSKTPVSRVEGLRPARGVIVGLLVAVAFWTAVAALYVLFA